MLLPDNIHPELSIYYNASFIIKELKTKNIQQLLDLFHKIKSVQDMSFPTFLLCLDWLYLIDVAYVNEKGEVKLCI